MMTPLDEQDSDVNIILSQSCQGAAVKNISRAAIFCNCA
jgi:hypothetical protein